MAEINADSLIISKITPADEKSYVDFLQQAYKDQFNSYRFKSRSEIEKFWRWEYAENPHEITGKPLVWICQAGEKIVGQLCVMPVTVKINDRAYRGGWCQDFMVLPEFRGRGIGQQLVCEAKKGLSDIIDIAMAVIATERSRALFRKQGFIEIGNINKGVLLRMAAKILLLIRRFNTAKNIEVQETDVFDAEFDDMWKCLSERFSCLINRDKEILGWRFAPQPYWAYRTFIAKEGKVPKGYIIVKIKKYDRIRQKGLNAGIISDIFFDPSETYVGNALIEKALNIMGDKTIIVRCDVMNPSMKRFLKSAGFIDMKSDNTFLLFLSERVAKKDVPLAKDKDSWYITYGDSDLDFS